MRLLLLGHFSPVLLCDPIDRSPPGYPVPGILQAKNTGVGCRFLFQCMKVKRESEVAQSCPTLSDPMDCSPPGSSVHGIFQARVLEWGFKVFWVGKESACNAGDPGFDPWVGTIPWRRAWQPAPVFLPGESHGQRSLAGYSPWGRRASDMTERLSTQHT